MGAIFTSTRALVVSNMRALDSCRDWLRILARLRAIGDEYAIHMAEFGLGLAALVGFKRSKAERLPYSPLRGSRGQPWRARKGCGCKLVAAARSSLRRRTTAAHLWLRIASSRITPLILFCSGASFVIRLKVAACRGSDARSGCDTQTPANLLKAASTPVLMIFPPTWLGCDGPRI